LVILEPYKTNKHNERTNSRAMGKAIHC